MSDKQPVVWIVDDDASIRWVLETALEETDFEIQTYDSPELPLRRLRKSPPTVVLTDVRMPGMDGLTFLEAIHEVDDTIPVIVMTAHADLEMAVDAYDRRVFEYVPKPFEVDEVVSLVQRAVRKRLSGRRRSRKASNADASPQGVNIIGQAPAMQEVFRIIGRVARTDVTVLING